MNVARNVLGAIVTLNRLTLLLTVRSDCMGNKAAGGAVER